MEQQNNNKYEVDSYDVSDDSFKEVKLDSNFYIHNALIKAQGALTKDDINGGFLQYIQLMEHIEVLCRSNRMLSANYDALIKNFKLSDEYTKETNGTVKLVKLAHKKLEGIMNEISETRPVFQELKL